jgi:mannosylfructose-phosphate synthase
MGRGRIAMISTHGYVAAVPPLGATDTGGQVVYVLELSKLLAGLGYTVDIWTRRFEDQPESEPVADGVQVIRVPCGGTAFIPKEYLNASIPEWVDNARHLIRERGLSYDFIDSHYWDAGIAGQLLGKALGIPHIHTPHSLGAWKKRQMETDSPQSIATFEAEYNFTERIKSERRIYHGAAAVIATTLQQQEILADDYGVSPAFCHVISPGFDEKRFYPVSQERRQQIRQRLGFSGNVAMAVGRLARNKGYDLLVNAFTVVASRDPAATLALFVGGDQAREDEEEMSRELRQQVRTAGLQDRVRFGSFIPDEELADYYRAADVFVLSSRYEPFGMTAIEAMACGTACVVTLHGGLSHAITFGLNGLYANPFDPEDLGITIYKVLQYPVVKSRLSRMGAKRVHAHFTWTRIAEQLVALVKRDRVPVAAEPKEEPWEQTGD